MGIRTVVLVAVAAAAGIDWLLRRAAEVRLPKHMEGHPAVFVPELFGADTQAELLALLASEGEIPSNTADLKFYKTLHEHIGEAQAPNAGGACDHPYLLPSGGQCVLPGRFDIARNFAVSGGVSGIKENLQTLFRRLMSFGIYLFDLESDRLAVVRGLFESKVFADAALAVCPPDQQFLDPFQFNFIVQVPGQAVATHVDGVYFWGASRFSFPQWLLAVMQYSGLFQDAFVNQVQVVGYVSPWDTDRVAAAPGNFGEFVYWPDTTPGGTRMAPLPRSGNSVDGSKLVHTTMPYMPNGDDSPPAIEKDKAQSSALKYNNATQRWDLVVDGASLGSYADEDLRISIVYRARCFADADEAARFQTQLKDDSAQMDLEQVLAKLVKHGRTLTSSPPPPLDDRLALAIWLVDTFVNYPLPDRSAALLPFNVCALFQEPNLVC